MKYIFGAAFDPITIGHIAIIKTIQKYLSKNDQLFVLMSNTDEKNYHTTFNERYKLVFETLKTIFNENMPIIMEQNRHTYEFLKEHFEVDNDITIVIGEDEWNALIDGKWVHSKELLNTYKFIVVHRNNNGELRDKVLYNVAETKLKDDYNMVSSSHVREIFYCNPETIYSDVKTNIHKKTFDLIKENHLYKQNGENYSEEMKEFLKDYAIKKVENNWSEPSVTADIVAYNGDQILLIRRKNKPFQNYWCCVGGFFDLTDEDLNHTAAREFEEETTLKYDPKKFVQIKTYSHKFDPRMRIIDVAFEVRINSIDMKNAIGNDDALEAKWFNINDLPPLGFHHNMIIEDWKAKHNQSIY